MAKIRAVADTPTSRTFTLVSPVWEPSNISWTISTTQDNVFSSLSSMTTYENDTITLYVNPYVSNEIGELELIANFSLEGNPGTESINIHYEFLNDFWTDIRNIEPGQIIDQIDFSGLIITGYPTGNGTQILDQLRASGLSNPIVDIDKVEDYSYMQAVDVSDGHLLGEHYNVAFQGAWRNSSSISGLGSWDLDTKIFTLENTMTLSSYTQYGTASHQGNILVHVIGREVSNG